MFDFFKKKELDIVKEEIIEEENFNNIQIISKYFHAETGITFDSQISILKNKVTSFCRKRKIYSFEKLLQDIQSNKNLKQELIDHLTTNETYFYREFKQIMELVSLVKQSSSKVSILCAPSSTGEEPYSIAIALLEAGVDASHFSILGIDINSDAVEKSEQAMYGERNLRNLSLEIIDKYFTKQDTFYCINTNIKYLVSFRVINIFDASFQEIGKFDFVFSRNMLIYFDKETKIKAKNILQSVRKSDKYDIFFGHADLF